MAAGRLLVGLMSGTSCDGVDAVVARFDGTPGGDWLIATQNGTRRALNDRSLAGLTFSHPLAALKVITAIHWQALKLWLKGARFIRYPGEGEAIQPRAPQVSAAE